MPTSSADRKAGAAWRARRSLRSRNPLTTGCSRGWPRWRTTAGRAPPQRVCAPANRRQSSRPTSATNSSGAGVSPFWGRGPARPAEKAYHRAFGYRDPHYHRERRDASSCYRVGGGNTYGVRHRASGRDNRWKNARQQLRPVGSHRHHPSRQADHRKVSSKMRVSVKPEWKECRRSTCRLAANPAGHIPGTVNGQVCNGIPGHWT